MGNRYQDKIDVFFGGRSRDPRIQDPNVFQSSQHFNIFKYPKKLVPMPAMAADEDLTAALVAFAYKNNNLYGLGQTSGFVKIYDKGADPIGGSWAASTSGADAGGQRNKLAFSMYHDVLFGLTNSTRIWAYNTATNTFTATALDLTSFTNTCRGLVTRDDLFLQPYDNKIAVKDGAGAGVTANWTLALITFLNDYVITDLCEFGDIVAVAARPFSLDKNSKVFLWDKVNADILDSIDCGRGTIKIIDLIDGELVMISEESGTTGSFSPTTGHIVFRKWTAGPQASEFFRMSGDFNTTVTLYGNNVKAVDSQKIVFGAIITMQGIAYKQLFKVGKVQQGDPLAVSPFILVDNDTAITSLEGMFGVESYNFIAHNNDGSVNRQSSSTLLSNRYNNVTPIYISQKINGERFAPGSARRNKQLVMAGLMFDAPITSGQSASLYYRVNGATSWTLLFTHSTVGDISRETGTDSTNTEIDKGKEYEFKVTSAGGLEVTGIYYEMEVLDGDVSEG